MKTNERYKITEEQRELAKEIIDISLPYYKIIEKLKTNKCDGSQKKAQLKEWERNFKFDKTDNPTRYIIKEVYDNPMNKEPKVLKENNKEELLDFCKRRHLKIISELPERLRVSDEFQYVCEFHPDKIQTATFRTIKGGIGCGYCKYPMSRFEVMIYLSLNNALHRTKIDGLEFDIFIPDKGIVIEYNGEFYHKNDEETGMMKRKEKVAKDNNLRFIIIEERLQTEIIASENYLIIPNYRTSTIEIKNKILKETNNILGGICNFTPKLFEKSADYIRDWKATSYYNDKYIENKKIKQYDEQGNLINEFNGFNEIKELIKSGSAFGFNWIIK